MKSKMYGNMMSEPHKFKSFFCRSKSEPLKKRQCNICGRAFEMKSRYERFCKNCRTGSEVYHYAEVMPEMESRADEYLRTSRYTRYI